MRERLTKAHDAIVEELLPVVLLALAMIYIWTVLVQPILDASPAQIEYTE